MSTPLSTMDLRPIEHGQVAYRQLQGLSPLYHVRLKHRDRTLAVLSGSSEQEAHQRAQRLAVSLSLECGSVTIEQA